MIEQEFYEMQSGGTEEGLPSPEAPKAPSHITAIKTLTRFARRKWMIAKVIAFATLIGIFVAYAIPVRYTARTMIMPPKQTQSTTTFLNSQMGLGPLADAAGGGILKDPNAIYIGLLKSRPVADALIRRFDLMKLYDARDMTAARKKLENNTLVTSEKSTLVSISVSDQDKNRAAELANAYTEELRSLTKAISFTEASKRRSFFQDQLNTAREARLESETALQQIQQNKGLVHLDAQAAVAVTSAAEVRAGIAAKEVELQGLRSYSTEHNPDVQLAERELSALQGEAVHLEQHNSSSEFSDLGLKDIPKAGLDYLRAQREVQYRQAFFDLLLRQYEAATLDEAKDAAVIQVVEPAIPPDRKSSPRRIAVILFFMVLGLAAACAHLYLQESAHVSPDTLRYLAEFRTALATK